MTAAHPSIAALVGLVALLCPAMAWAQLADRCLAVSQAPRLIQPADYRPAALKPTEVRLTFVGHSTWLIESAAGYDAMRTLASAPGVERLVFGSIDFQVDLGIDGEGDELLMFRSQMVLVSKLAGLRAPVDGVSTAIDDAEALRADAERARRLGFGAKLCIHPKQVAIVERAFAPSEAEREWARRVLDAAARAKGGVVAVDGRMVDKPVMLRARAILDDD